MEKQGKQKPADKVEPKFKVGDWVVCKNGSHRVFQVIERSWPNAKYRDIKGTEMFLNVFTLDKQYRPWIIQDAKDGDVLVYPDGTLTIFRYRLSGLDAGLYMAHIVLTDKIELKQTCAIANAYPATKEQRDTLMKAMADAGYEWDADKKELKEIKKKPKKCMYSKDDYTDEDRLVLCDGCDEICELKQKHAAWSEEDERIIRDIINTLSIGVFYKESALHPGAHTTLEEAITWLESLKERYTWKPSDEQMKALSIAMCGVEDPLFSLYQDLKKL